MAIYSLHEMAGLLKTGLWQGGEVEKLGYIGTAVPHASPAPACGLIRHIRQIRQIAAYFNTFSKPFMHLPP